MVDEWLGFGDCRLAPEARSFETPRFHGLPCGEDKVASALQHGFHLLDAQLPPGKLREIAVAEKFTERSPMPCERTVDLTDQIAQKLLGRSMRSAHRKCLLDEGTHDLGDQVGEGARLLRAQKLAGGQEFFERNFIKIGRAHV